METFIGILMEDPGIFIGLGFVLVATWFLPARIRWYVFTAGIAVVAFRAYQIYWAKKRLKELDEQREELRGELEDLRSRNQELENRNKQLNQEFMTIKKERNDLLRKRKDLEAQGDTFSKEKEDLDRRLDAKDVEYAENREKAMGLVNFLSNLAKTENQLSTETSS